MWNEIDVLRDVSARFDKAAIPFMLTGSLAMNHYALPRMTRDIDLVVHLPPQAVFTFVELFTPDYYLVDEAIRNAISHQSIFNLIHQESVIQVDCIVKKSTLYRQEEFRRRCQVRVADFQTWIVSKEDLILSKLCWARDSESELQLRDVRNLITTGFDAAYLQRWLPELNLLSLWKKVSHD